MFKLVILYALIAISVARPYLDDNDYETQLVYSTPLDQQLESYQVPIVTKFGNIIKNIPVAVSHQRQSIVHVRNNVVAPNLARFVKNYVGNDVTKAYSAPLFRPYKGTGQLEYGYDNQYW